MVLSLYVTSSSRSDVLSMTLIELTGHVWAHISHLTQLSSIFAGFVNLASSIAFTGHSSAHRLHLTHSGDTVINFCQ